MRGSHVLTAIVCALASLHTSTLWAIQFGADDPLTWESAFQNAHGFIADVFGSGATLGARRAAVLGAMLSGVACGVLGSFVTLRRMALFGDMIGHAVLPGVAVGFLFAGRKDPLALVLGALGAGLLAAWLTRQIRARSIIREDAALGISLSLFYALGIWLLSWILRTPRLSSEASGLKQYLFGNPAVILPLDLGLLVISTVGVVVVVTLLFKEFVVQTFDANFARSIGRSRRGMDALLIVLLTGVVVVSIHILGVVLVAAMLTIPPATAYLLTDRMSRMCILSATFGALGGGVGIFASAVLGIGAGPAIVCVSFAGLLAAFLFAPHHGVVRKWRDHSRLVKRTARENVLATTFRLQERARSFETPIALSEVARERESPLVTITRLARELARRGDLRLDGDRVLLTGSGLARAQEIVRSHRLWELFLEREAALPSDHVHAAAEEIEHVLSPDHLVELERFLEYPETDPHGRPIPGTSASTGTESPGEPR